MRCFRKGVSPFAALRPVRRLARPAQSRRRIGRPVAPRSLWPRIFADAGHLGAPVAPHTSGRLVRLVRVVHSVRIGRLAVPRSVRPVLAVAPRSLRAAPPCPVAPRRAPFASAQRSPRRASSRPVRPGAPSVPSRSGCPGAPFAPSGRPGTPAVTRAPCAPSSHAARSPRRAAPSMHHLLVYLQSPIIVACEKRGGDAPRGTLSRAESFIKAVLLKPPAPP